MTVRDDTYNGWTNRETWACHLWITNDQTTDQEARQICTDTAQQCEDWYADHPQLGPTPDEAPAFRAGEQLAEWWADLTDMEEAITAAQYPAPTSARDRNAAHVRQIAAMLTDVGSTWRINWTEIAAALLTP